MGSHYIIAIIVCKFVVIVAALMRDRHMDICVKVVLLISLG